MGCQENEDTIIKCYWCEKIVALKSFRKVQKIENINGIVWDFGYSLGGWGSRKNYTQGSGEVCNECFEIYKNEVKKWEELYKNRKGINKSQLSIINKEHLKLTKSKFNIFNIFVLWGN